MRFRQVKSLGIACAVMCLAAGLFADPAFAQAPGQPQVTVNPDNSVTVNFVPASPTPTTGYGIAASFNGVPIFTTTSPFFIGGITSFRTPTLPDGSYIAQIVAINGTTTTAGPTATFVIGSSGPVALPFTNVMNAPVINGSNVTLSWSAIANAASYEVEAVVQATGQTFLLPVGNQTTLTVPNVPFGNYIVRVRGRNALGVGQFSNQIIVVVGVILGGGDLQVTLTWNTPGTDMDLHVIEPNGNHVYYASRTGTTARLDVDDRDGFGPENIFVTSAQAAAGTYQIYIVYFSGAPPTTSTIAVNLRPGTANAQTLLFTRTTNSSSTGVGYNVANVNIQTGQITETFGTRAADERGVTIAKSRQ
jgi:hypothetical protein